MRLQGKFEEAGDASFQTECTQGGKIWKSKCHPIGKIKCNLQFPNHTVKYAEAGQCYEKFHQAVVTLVNFCYKTMAYVCQVHTKNPGPSCFCFTLN